MAIKQLVGASEFRRYFREYVVHYTNAGTIIGEEYQDTEDLDGVFSGLMEYTGDYSENPFEGLLNDVPVYAIIRNIEIDLREMIGDGPLPERMKPVSDVLF